MISRFFLAITLVFGFLPAFGTLEPREKTYQITALVLIEPSGAVSLVVNPLSRTRMTIEVQNPALARQEIKEKSYVGVVDVEMDFYRTAQRQPTAIIKKIKKSKESELPVYDGDFKKIDAP